MFKLLRRFVAYFIDLMVVMLIAQSLSGIPAINKQLDDYNKYDYIIENDGTLEDLKKVIKFELKDICDE